MISGRADCSDDWLPARIRPVRGESFDSLCRQLAEANGITPTGLLRGCMSKYPGAHTSMEAVAHCIGVEPVALERLTVAEVRRRWGRRLATTVWLCRHCSARSIEDALRSR
jgi:ribosomal protein L37AE/L43A